MSNIFLFLICFLTFFILTSLAFYAPSYNDTVFGINFKRNTAVSHKIIYNFRLIFFKLSIIFFPISFLLDFKRKDLLSLSLLTLLYSILIAIKYKENREIIKKEVFTEKEPEKSNTTYYFSLELIHFIHLTFFAFSLFEIFIFKKTNGEYYNKIFLIYPLSEFYTVLLSIFISRLIMNAPTFANKKVNLYLSYLVQVASLTIIMIFLGIMEIHLGFPDYYALIILLAIIIFLNIFIYKFYIFIKSINIPYEFKVLNEKNKSEKFIDISPNGNEFLINYKSKNGYIFICCFFLLVFLYGLCIYLLII